MGSARDPYARRCDQVEPPRQRAGSGAADDARAEAVAAAAAASTVVSDRGSRAASCVSPNGRTVNWSLKSHSFLADRVTNWQIGKFIGSYRCSGRWEFVAVRLLRRGFCSGAA